MGRAAPRMRFFRKFYDVSVYEKFFSGAFFSGIPVEEKRFPRLFTAALEKVFKPVFGVGVQFVGSNRA